MSTRNRFNKKRAPSLVVDIIARWVSRAIVEGRESDASRAVAILKRHFAQGTELHREYRLAESLVRAQVSAPMIAASILSEAKRAARSHDVSLLEKEKSKLLEAVSRDIDDPHFWDTPVPFYRAHATAQTLINDWRRDPKDIDLVRLAQYEERMSSWLLEPKEEPKKLEEMRGNPGEDRLLLRIMARKLEERYGEQLNPLQRSLLREHVLNSDGFLRASETLRKNLLDAIDAYVRERPSSGYEISKLLDLRTRASGEAFLGEHRSHDESHLVDALDAARLIDELSGRD